MAVMKIQDIIRPWLFCLCILPFAILYFSIEGEK